MTDGGRQHVAVKGDVVGAAVEADEIALLLPFRSRRLVLLARMLGVGLGIEAGVGLVAPIFLVAPFVTCHHVEVVIAQVLVVLCVGAVNQVILVFLRIA